MTVQDVLIHLVYSLNKGKFNSKRNAVTKRPEETYTEPMMVSWIDTGHRIETLVENIMAENDHRRET
jgi:hypothetical protein